MVSSCPNWRSQFDSSDVDLVVLNLELTIWSHHNLYADKEQKMDTIIKMNFFLAWEDKVFVKWIKDPFMSNWNNSFWTEDVAYDITYYPPKVQYWVPNYLHLGLPSPSNPHEGWRVTDPQVNSKLTCVISSVKTLWHSIKQLQLSSSQLEMKKTPGWEVKCL